MILPGSGAFWIAFAFYNTGCSPCWSISWPSRQQMEPWMCTCPSWALGQQTSQRFLQWLQMLWAPIQEYISSMYTTTEGIIFCSRVSAGRCRVQMVHRRAVCWTEKGPYVCWCPPPSLTPRPTQSAGRPVAGLVWWTSFHRPILKQVLHLRQGVNWEAQLTVILKCPQIWTDFLSYFRTGTMGAAQSANCTGLRITRCSKSFSTRACME